MLTCMIFFIAGVYRPKRLIEGGITEEPSLTSGSPLRSTLLLLLFGQ